MLSLPVEFKIFCKLYGSSIVAHYFYKTINSRSKIEILEETP